MHHENLSDALISRQTSHGELWPATWHPNSNSHTSLINYREKLRACLLCKLLCLQFPTALQKSFMLPQTQEVTRRTASTQKPETHVVFPERRSICEGPPNPFTVTYRAQLTVFWSLTNPSAVEVAKITSVRAVQSQQKLPSSKVWVSSPISWAVATLIFRCPVPPSSVELQSLNTGFMLNKSLKDPVPQMHHSHTGMLALGNHK